VYISTLKSAENVQRRQLCGRDGDYINISTVIRTLWDQQHRRLNDRNCTIRISNADDY